MQRWDVREPLLVCNSSPSLVEAEKWPSYAGTVSGSGSVCLSEEGCLAYPSEYEDSDHLCLQAQPASQGTVV